MSDRVIIVGGGIIGAFSAHYLAQRGTDVVILDRSKFGRGCSHGNCGLVCPSHVLPLSVPGAIKKTLRAMFGRRSPFYIKPRFSPALWSWLWRFAGRCNKDHMLEAGEARMALLNSSMQLYGDMLAKPDFDVEWEQRGSLLVHQHLSEFDDYARTNELIRETFGLAAEPVEGKQLRELEPALVEGLAGGWHYPCDAHLRPDRLMTALRSSLESAGVEIRESTQVQSFDADDSRCRAVVTNQGERLAADQFLLATGAWSPQLQKRLGTKIPIQPGKGYSVTTARPRDCPRLPLLFEAHKVVVTPMQSGYRLGSTMEFSGYDTSLNRRRLEALKVGATHYLREPYSDQIQEEWYGWRPMTYDGLPIIDRTPAMNNFHVAAGHNMLGLSMGPATGKLIAEMLNGETPHIPSEPYSFARFQKSRRSRTA